VAFPRKLLNDEEEIILDLHPHWVYFAPQLGALLGSLIIGAAVLMTIDVAAVQMIAGVLILGCLMVFGARYSQWATTHFVVTNERLIHRTGVVTKKGIEIPLQRVNTVHFSQNLFERILRFGDLVIESAGQQGQQRIDDIRNPTAVQNEIYIQKEAKENRRFDRLAESRGVPTDASPAEPSIPAQIRKLDELRKDGVLSEEEFNEKKQELLDRM
jgi:uncharacterized membrane protein YdbT with pleckstrin-like domain